MSKCIELSTLNSCSFLCVSYASTKRCKSILTQAILLQKRKAWWAGYFPSGTKEWYAQHRDNAWCCS